MQTTSRPFSAIPARFIAWLETAEETDLGTYTHHSCRRAPIILPDPVLRGRRECAADALSDANDGTPPRSSDRSRTPISYPLQVFMDDPDVEEIDVNSH